MTAHTRLARPLVSSIRKALTQNALPGETEGLTRATEREAAEFLAASRRQRERGEVAIAIESTGGEAGRRRMRIAIVNDDMPFLVDSVANAIAGTAADHPPTASPGRLRRARQATASCCRSSRLRRRATAANR